VEFVAVGERKKSEANLTTDLPEGWVRTHDYIGPDRRRGRSILPRPKKRLDDAGARDHQLGASLGTLLRRLRVQTELDEASREERAAIVSVLETVAIKGAAEGDPSWARVARAAAEYLRAVGANGPLDAALVEQAIRAASEAYSSEDVDPVDPGLFSRLRDATLNR
jgi:hypothetical protein